MKIEGKVATIIFKNELNQWTVMLIKTKDGYITAVGETDDPKVSRITIVSSGDERTIEQIEKQLNKKLDVIKVKTFEENNSINCEVMLVKVKYNRNNRRDIMEICDIMDAKIVDMSGSQMIIRVCDTPQRTAQFLSQLKGISIIEVARCGTLALPKCEN